MANEILSAPQFDWMPIYGEIAHRLLEYREPAKQRELIAMLEDLRQRGLTISPLEDKDEHGKRFLIEELDPFTFMGVFNRGLGHERRRRILEELKKIFGLAAAVPAGFDGVPVLNNMKSWFVAYRLRRGPDDVARLWDVFARALGDDPLADPAFAASFDRALEVRSTNVNLTMGLFWIRPNTFASLDSAMRAHLAIKLPPEGLSFQFYRQTLDRIRDVAAGSLPELSYAAWRAQAAPPPAPAEPAADTNYWLVGAYWESASPADQTDRFLAEGVWENGYEDRHLDLIRDMKPGDRIAIKAATTQQRGLPFDNLGKTVSRMMVKARGTIVRNRGDGRVVEVEWEPRATSRDWYFYTARTTVWRLRKDQEMAKKLIRFVFYDEPQDHGFFVEEWWGKAPSAGTVPPPDDNDVDVAPPYSAADVVADGTFLAEDDVRRLLARLESKKALVLQGAPGVGKTFLARKLAYALMESRDDARVTSVQFHPSFSYEDFVRGYRPGIEAGKFELKEGPFWRVCDRAQLDPDRRHVLIIDEINRGHLSQVFGELFMLLEADKRGRANGVTPLYRRFDDEKFFVPENVYVIGTMNIADRSLALVDFALRRRFAFITLEPQFTSPMFRSWLVGRKMSEQLVERVVQKMGVLNGRIAADSQLGPAFRIGHSFFCPRGDDFSSHDASWFRDVVDTEIIPLLEEYWHDAPEKVRGAAEELRT